MSRGLAKLAFTQGLAVWMLEAADGFGDPGFHSHHAIQVTVSFRGTLALETATDSLAGRALAVSPDISHKITAEGLLGLVFVEPESRAGRALMARLFGGRGLVAIDDPEFLQAVAPLREAFDPAMDRARMLELAASAVFTLAGTTRPRGADPRIQRIIDHAVSNPDQPLGRTAESAGVFLSESRLRHLFVEQTGLAFKTYLVWLRLLRAVELYANGASLTEAAHSAGFADSAHFSRHFKRTFGSPATTLTRL